MSRTKVEDGNKSPAAGLPRQESNMTTLADMTPNERAAWLLPHPDLIAVLFLGGWPEQRRCLAVLADGDMPTSHHFVVPGPAAPRADRDAAESIAWPDFAFKLHVGAASGSHRTWHIGNDDYRPPGTRLGGSAKTREGARIGCVIGRALDEATAC